MKIPAWKKSCGTLAVSRTKGVLLSNKIHTSTHIYLCRQMRMGVDLRWSRLKTFDMRTSSMSSLIGRDLLIYRPISTRDVLATSGAQKVPSFSRVSMLCICFPFLPLFLTSCQTSVGGLWARLSSNRPSEPNTGSFVHRSECLLPWS